MLGVLANSMGIVLGAFFGLMLKRFLSRELLGSIEYVLGLVALLLGLKMAIGFNDPVVLVVSFVLGATTGHLLNISAFIKKVFGQIKITKGETEHSQGFLNASLIFCTGSMAIIGSINSGLLNDHQVLYTKAFLDGVSSISFAALYGFGVMGSAVSVLLYQGLIALCASQLNILSDPHILNNLSSTGGILLVMLGLNISGIRKIEIEVYLPAMAYAVLLSLFKL